ncbi:hypothetical protein AVEN_210174-1 [Araneus ventricosus]|uniref:Uncharacterized protein n=1 Tax=Araneus ventricosus TaxID=182803 RepID=A0A4Y2ME94_ARAVE|nr:hypothetical protein AVEN_210174-1 [Araneus ventricosus]
MWPRIEHNTTAYPRTGSLDGSLLVGWDNRNFLMPWLICVSTATLLDVFLCVYFTAKDSSERFHSILFVTDFFFSALNVYCLLCVISQYQEYSAGRGRPEDCIRMQVLNRLPVDEERVPAESIVCNLLTVPEPSIEPANKLPQSPGLNNSCTSMRCIVEICHNESFSGDKIIFICLQLLNTTF